MEWTFNCPTLCQVCTIVLYTILTTYFILDSDGVNWEVKVPPSSAMPGVVSTQPKAVDVAIKGLSDISKVDVDGMCMYD